MKSMPQSGDHILHYTILSPLGKGAVGQVFKALDTLLMREVALKFLSHATDESRQRLRIEAQAIAQLDHANIVTIYAIEEYEGTLFLAMAYYEGHNVKELLESSSPPSPQQKLALFKQAVAGIAHAHQHDIIHRDIKPANIFVTNDGIVKVLDFGVAHLPDSNITHQDQLMGTPNYMSPEQLRADTVDTRSDIWSLSVVLFEMFSNTLPFKDGLPQVLVSILHDEPKHLTPFFPHAALDALIQQGLIKERERRLASCIAFLEALESINIEATHIDNALPLTDSNHLIDPLAPHGLLGRDHDITTIVHKLQAPDVDILTITGIGGVGKTSLARAVMIDTRLDSTYPDGCFFIALENVQDVLQIDPLIANLVGIQLSTSEPFFSLQQFFADKKVLLIFDNFDHLVNGYGDKLALLLTSAPYVDILATSRYPLGLESEHTYPLEGLSVPESLENDFYAYGATALFISKAKRIKASFDAINEKKHILRICQQLKGLPLGIEMAVAGITKRSAQDIAQDIAQQLSERQASTALVLAKNTTEYTAEQPQKHTREHPQEQRQEHTSASSVQSARAAFDYSWNMLDSNEQEALIKLAVFKAGFSAEAAWHVTKTSLEHLIALLDQSLLIIRDNGLYDYHALVGEFCYQKLQERSDANAIFMNYVTYYVNFAKENAPQLRGATQLETIALFADKHDNFLSVLTWLEAHDPLQGLELALLLTHFWFIKNDFALGMQWLGNFRSKLDNHASLALRAQGLHNEGVFAWNHYNYAQAESLLRESLRLYQSLEAQHGTASVLATLGNLTRIQRRYDVSKPFLEQSLALFRTQGNIQGEAGSLAQLGLLAYQQGDTARALRLLQDALLLRQRASDKLPLASVHMFFGVVLMRRDYQRAQQHLQESITILTPLGQQRSLVSAFAHLGWLHVSHDNVAEAKKAYESSISHLQKLNSKMMTGCVLAELGRVMQRLESPHTALHCFALSEKLIGEQEAIIAPRMIAGIPQAIATLRSDVGEATYAELWNEGQALTVDKVLEEALQIMRSQTRNVFASSFVSASLLKGSNCC